MSDDKCHWGPGEVAACVAQGTPFHVKNLQAELQSVNESLASLTRTEVHDTSSYTLAGVAGVALFSVGSIIMFKKWNKKSQTSEFTQF